MGEMGEGNDEFMGMLNSMAKDLLSGDQQSQNKALENIMNEFNTFLADTENDPQMKDALN